MINKKLLIFFICVSKLSLGQINWQTKWDDALVEATEKGKTLMVECYHPTCPHCTILNGNLENTDIINTVNENYISYKINLADFDQIEILKKYNIRLPNWPMILFFDATGQFINYFEPNENPEILNKQFLAEKEVSCIPCREKEFFEMNELLKCTLYSKILQDLSFNNELANKIYEKMDDSLADRSNSWLIFKKFVLATDNQYFNFWVDNLKMADEIEKNPDIVRNVIASMLQAKTQNLTKQKSISLESIEELKVSLKKLGADETKITAWTWNLDLVYYLKQNDEEKATALCNKLTIMYQGQTTYLMLYKVICDNEAQKLMYLYYLKNQQYLESTLKNPDELRQYHVLSSSFFGKNKQKNSCQESLTKAIEYGLSEDDYKELMLSNCN